MKLWDAMALREEPDGDLYLLLMLAWDRLSDEDREAVAAELCDHQAWRAERSASQG